ncbi:unnamed protein product [Didymodactylos carnosus]|uniref:Uncharacterized protein n=1 Tax=Didymodactylos carnosus TaxID=1234261 RepID=A0A815ZBT4_9BILA|nr:unnamed protein product [Didymodactylos carnosus]CAF1581504.1 unnamed protein product [Didymodactylos carnosus]CAF4271904.1 unnamed protein product [Didymodactylos carnosus]CAF4449308.1 unnamed protein product [Didymodactylos carnosus]
MINNLIVTNIISLNDIDEQQSVRTLSTEHPRFMWMRQIEILFFHMSISDMEMAKKNMIDECCKFYYNDEIELKRIQTFWNDYHPSKAIWWYTSDSFLYRLLNRAFRTENILLLNAFRFFMIDLRNQLSELYQTQYTNNTQIFYVYRGQGMSVKELQKIRDNIGGFLSINTFFSTTVSSSLAADFAGDSFSQLIYERSVVFQMEIDPRICPSRSPFANISKHSSMPSEDEILFSMGTIFRIDLVEELEIGGLWIVTLTMTNEYDKNFDRLCDLYQQNLNEKPEYIIIGDLYISAGQYEKAELHYLKRLYVPDVDIGLINRQLGYIYYLEDENDLAKAYYKSAITRFQEVNNYEELISTYCDLAMMHTDCGKYKLALKILYKAKTICNFSSNFI